jgi:MYXO-CTERM domain-containing protein
MATAPDMTATPDLAEEPDLGVEPPTMPVPAIGAMDSGCGCDLGGAGANQGAGALLVALLVGAVLTRSRRRQQS